MKPIVTHRKGAIQSGHGVPLSPVSSLRTASSVTLRPSGSDPHSPLALEYAELKHMSLGELEIALQKDLSAAEASTVAAGAPVTKVAHSTLLELSRYVFYTLSMYQCA